MKSMRIVVGLMLSLAATVALAHAHLKKAVPADGGVVSSSPANVVLSFSEPAHLTACWIQKTDGPKQKITGLPTSASPDITVPLPQLEPGAYVLSWNVVGDDTHVVPGQIHFTVSGAAAQH
ncbi:MAG TPA: copper resistance protein CopC [Steroidobacteraceae bacterium]